MKKEYPIWLEHNWEKLSQEDLERYNKQLEKITEICDTFSITDSKDSTKIFEMLGELQELGTPP